MNSKEIENIVNDACEHAKLYLLQEVDHLRENRKTDSWYYDWEKMMEESIPKIIGIAISQSLVSYENIKNSKEKE